VEPNAFVAEVYRRMSLRSESKRSTPTWEEIKDDPIVFQATHQYKSLLPVNKDSAILDIGFGRGWFIAVCINLGYSNIFGAEFGTDKKYEIKNWSKSVKEIYKIRTNIGDLLAKRREQYDFIHLSHVLEHVPKYTLLYVVDSLYLGLKKGGTLLVRVPNMEGPCATSKLYVTLGHEYGFSGSNLVSLLTLSNFEDIKFHHLGFHNPTIKQRLGTLLRWPFIKWNSIRHRLFGVNYGGHFEKEIVVSAKRKNAAPLFDIQYR
jgi:SAM-dependent methyltransferase